MKSEDIIKHVKETAKILGGEFKHSQNGVPHIIMKGTNCKISLVFVARSAVWKAFHPYPSQKQEREYFATIKGLISFLQLKGCKIANP